jgi:hypothetical protein
MAIPRYRKRSAGKNKKEKQIAPTDNRVEPLAISCFAGIHTRPWFPLLILAVAVAAVYGHTLNYPFIFDDSSSIRDNSSIYDLKDIGSIWNFAPMRFVGYLTFALNYHFHRYNVFGYHLFNIAIHFFSGAAGYVLLRGLFQAPVARQYENLKNQMLLHLFFCCIRCRPRQ